MSPRPSFDWSQMAGHPAFCGLSLGLEEGPSACLSFWCSESFSLLTFMGWGNYIPDFSYPLFLITVI